MRLVSATSIRGWLVRLVIAVGLIMSVTGCDLGTLLPTTFHVENDHFTALNVFVRANGTTQDALIPPGGEEVWEFRDNPGIVSFSATTQQRTTSGKPLGRLLTWAGSANLSGSGFTTQRFESGGNLVYLFIRNTGDSRLTNIRVYEASGTEWHLDVGVPPDGVTYGMGFFMLASRVSACFEDASSCIEWTGMDYPVGTNLRTTLSTEGARPY